jgi:predicted MPP superfamily phosphohydrolase
VRVFLQAVFGQILINAYILWRGYGALPPKKKWRLPFVLAFALEWILYFTGFFFHHLIPDNIWEPIMMVCNTWYILSVYVAMGLLILEIARITQKYWKWYPKFVRRYIQKIKLLIFFTFVAAIIGLFFVARHNALSPVVKHVYVNIPKTITGRDSLKIAMLSDMHMGEMIGKQQVSKFVALCNEQHPDLIVLTGDQVDYEVRIPKREHLENELRKFNAPLGVYIINGNHEFRADRIAKRKWMQSFGGVLLVDSVVQPDSTFYLVGRDDFINRGRAPLNELVGNLDKRKPIVVLDHQPEAFYEAVMNKADLVLHGHTHGGQLWPMVLALKIVNECPYGYYKKGNTQFYVSAGIGFAGPPIRVGTRSELVVLHVTFN